MNQLQQDENTEFKCAKFILEDPTILCTVYTRGCAAGYPSQLTLGERSQEMLTFEAGCINRSAIHQIISYKGGLNGITHLRAHRTYLIECTNFDLPVLRLTSAPHCTLPVHYALTGIPLGVCCLPECKRWPNWWRCKSTAPGAWWAATQKTHIWVSRSGRHMAARKSCQMSAAKTGMCSPARPW